MIADALLALRHAMGLLTNEISAQGFINADVNDDGIVDVTDAVIILRYALGMI